MKCRFLMLFFFLLTSAGIQAQKDIPVLLTEVSKGVKVVENAQSKWLKVKEPSVVSSQARIKLNGKARLTLYGNNVSKTLEGKGEYLLGELFAEQQQMPLSDWQTQFNNFLFAVKKQGMFGKQLPADNAPIKTLSPAAGKLATFEIHFYWQTSQDIADLKLEIADTDGKVQYTAEVSGGETTVDPRKARLFPGKEYSWRVYSASQVDLSSGRKTFQMNTLGLKGTLLPVLQQEKAYQETTTPFLKSFMEAAYFESQEWYFDADQIYRKLLEKEPQNALYQLFYQAFLQRCGIGG